MQLIPGWIRQLTERPPPPDGLRLEGLVGAEGTGKYEVRGTSTGRMTTGKDMNIRIQSAAADIVTKLIAADIIHSQRWDQVDEIIRDVLVESFGGTGMPSAPQPIVKSR